LIKPGMTLPMFSDDLIARVAMNDVFDADFGPLGRFEFRFT
jgi:hypothetical protein